MCEGEGLPLPVDHLPSLGELGSMAQGLSDCPRVSYAAHGSEIEVARKRDVDHLAVGAQKDEEVIERRSRGSGSHWTEDQLGALGNQVPLTEGLGQRGGGGEPPEERIDKRNDLVPVQVDRRR